MTASMEDAAIGAWPDSDVTSGRYQKRWAPSQ